MPPLDIMTCGSFGSSNSLQSETFQANASNACLMSPPSPVSVLQTTTTTVKGILKPIVESTSPLPSIKNKKVTKKVSFADLDFPSFETIVQSDDDGNARVAIRQAHSSLPVIALAPRREGARAVTNASSKNKLQPEYVGVSVDAATYNQWGNVFYRKGDFHRAQEAYYRAARVTTVGLHTADAYNNLGAVYWTTGDLIKAEHNLKQALDLYMKFLWDKKLLAKVLSSVSGAHRTPNQLHLAVANVYHQLGLVHALQAAQEKTTTIQYALSALHHALWIRQQFGASNVVLSQTFDAIGQVYCLVAQDYHTSVVWFNRALSLNKRLSTLDSLAWTYGQLEDWTSVLNVFHDMLQELRPLYDEAVKDGDVECRRDLALNMVRVLQNKIIIFNNHINDNNEHQIVDAKQGITTATAEAAAKKCRADAMNLAKREGIMPQELGLEKF